MIYTNQMHASNLLNLLNQRYIYHICPTDYLAERTKNSIHDQKSLKPICITCLRFLGKNSTICPCNLIGPVEARKQTWIALDEKGYL